MWTPPNGNIHDLVPWCSPLQGLDGFQKSLCPCALGESRLSIGRVILPTLCILSLWHPEIFSLPLIFSLVLIFQVFTTSDHERPENPHENPCNIFTATYFSPVFCIPGIYLLRTWVHPKPTWEPRISTITEHHGWGHIEIHRGRHRRAPTRPTLNTGARETKWTGPSFLSLTIKVAGRVSRTAPRKSSPSSPICQQGKKARVFLGFGNGSRFDTKYLYQVGRVVIPNSNNNFKGELGEERIIDYEISWT